MVQTSKLQLKEVCEFIIDCEHKTAPIQQTGYPSIRTPNIGKGRLILDGVNRVSEETYKLWIKRAIPQTGDLILAREAPIGNVAVIPRNLKVCLGQRTVLIRPNKKMINPLYLLYLLLGDEIQGKIQSISNGATVHHLNMEDIRNLELPILPSIQVQNKIASILSAYDDLIENNTRSIQLLEETAQLIYREWFIHIRFPGYENVKMVDSTMGKIPEGWEFKKFTDIADVLSGGTPKTKVNEYWDGTIPFFTPKDAPANSFFVLKTEKTITKNGLNHCNSKLYPKNTVFITARGTVGKTLLNTVDMAMSQSCYALRGKEGISQYYIFFTILTKVELLKKNATGAVFDTIVVDTFRNLDIIKPTFELLNKFSELIKPIMELIENLENKNNLLQETRDLLLPKLISGELDVSNSDIDMSSIDLNS